MLGDRLQESPAELELWKSSDIILPDKTQEKIRRLIDGDVEVMDFLDREILETEQRLRNLKQRKETDAARIATLCAATSSAKKIPPEILADIFVHLSPVELLLPPMYRYPWVLGYVCAYWREVL